MTVVMVLMMIGDPTMIECPLEEEDIMKGVEGHWIEGMVMTEVFLEEEDPLMMEDLLMMEDPLMEMEGPLMEMVDPRTSWTSATCYCATAPCNVRHDSSR